MPHPPATVPTPGAPPAPDDLPATLTFFLTRAQRARVLHTLDCPATQRAHALLQALDIPALPVPSTAPVQSEIRLPTQRVTEEHRERKKSEKVEESNVSDAKTPLITLPH